MALNSLLKTGSKALSMAGARGFSAAAAMPERKVVILGAAGGIGQPLGLLMKVGGSLKFSSNSPCLYPSASRSAAHRLHHSFYCIRKASCHAILKFVPP